MSWKVIGDDRMRVWTGSHCSWHNSYLAPVPVDVVIVDGTPFLAGTEERLGPVLVVFEERRKKRRDGWTAVFS